MEKEYKYTATARVREQGDNEVTWGVRGYFEDDVTEEEAKKRTRDFCEERGYIVYDIRIKPYEERDRTSLLADAKQWELEEENDPFAIARISLLLRNIDKNITKIKEAECRSADKLEVPKLPSERNSILSMVLSITNIALLLLLILLN